MNTIEINGRTIGPAFPAYIIAEMSANHNQDFAQAVAIIKAAKVESLHGSGVDHYPPLFDSLLLLAERVFEGDYNYRF